MASGISAVGRAATVERQSMDIAIDSGETTLACPACKAPLAAAAPNCACTACGAAYRSLGGIASFSSHSTALGEFSSEEMEQLLRAAEESGWKTALATYVKPKNPAVLDLILDPRRTSFLALLPGMERGVALDFGCGFGGISIQLAKRCRQVYAMDSGLQRLRFLDVAARQERIGNVRAVHHEDAVSLPFADRSIDLIVLVGVFEYLPLAYPELSIEEVQSRVLTELRRVLVPGGHLYIGTKNRFGWPYLKGGKDHNQVRFGPALPRALADLLSRRLHGKPYRIIVDSFRGYRSMLRDAGFAEPDIYWPLPGYQVPVSFTPLGAGVDRAPLSAGDHAARGPNNPLIRLLQSAGMLQHVVPHFSIVARRPTDDG